MKNHSSRFRLRRLAPGLRPGVQLHSRRASSMSATSSSAASQATLSAYYWHLASAVDASGKPIAALQRASTIACVCPSPSKA